jgi:hypothetical protein
MASRRPAERRQSRGPPMSTSAAAIREHALRYPPLALGLACACEGRQDDPFVTDFPTWLRAAGPRVEQVETVARLRSSADESTLLARLVEAVYGRGHVRPLHVFGEGTEHGSVVLGGGFTAREWHPSAAGGREEDGVSEPRPPAPPPRPSGDVPPRPASGGAS